MSEKSGRGYNTDHPAIVLGLFDTGLAVVRSLARSGIRVTGLDSDPGMPGFWSRYCASRIFPDPACRPEDALEIILNKADHSDKQGILFPATDAFVLFMSRYRQALGRRYRFNLPSPEVIESIVDKKRQYELAMSNGTCVPDTWFPEDRGDLVNLKHSVRYPVIVKGRFTFKWQRQFQGIKGFRADGPDQLEKILGNALSAGVETVVQSIIPGPNTNHFKVCVYIDQAGRLLALFMLRKIRQYPVEFGVGTCVESMECENLKRTGLKFFNGIGYRGVGSIEFKLDDRDGRLKFIELNPRYWQQNGHASACGLDFPLVHYLDLTGQHSADARFFRYATGVKWLDPASDFQSFCEHRRARRLSFTGWLRSLRGVKSFSTLARDDMAPFLKDIGFGMKIARMPLYYRRRRS